MRQRFRHEAEEDVVALALAVARRILHRELTVAPEALLGLVKAALEKMEAREVHSVRVRPEDAPMVQQYLEKMGLPQRVGGDARDPRPGARRGDSRFEPRRSWTLGRNPIARRFERGFADLVRRV